MRIFGNDKLRCKQLHFPDRNSLELLQGEHLHDARA